MTPCQEGVREQKPQPHTPPFLNSLPHFPLAKATHKPEGMGVPRFRVEKGGERSKEVSDLCL